LFIAEDSMIVIDVSCTKTVPEEKSYVKDGDPKIILAIEKPLMLNKCQLSNQKMR